MHARLAKVLGEGLARDLGASRIARMGRTEREHARVGRDVERAAGTESLASGTQQRETSQTSLGPPSERTISSRWDDGPPCRAMANTPVHHCGPAQIRGGWLSIVRTADIGSADGALSSQIDRFNVRQRTDEGHPGHDTMRWSPPCGQRPARSTGASRQQSPRPTPGMPASQPRARPSAGCRTMCPTSPTAQRRRNGEARWNRNDGFGIFLQRQDQHSARPAWLADRPTGVARGAVHQQPRAAAGPALHR